MHLPGVPDASAEEVSLSEVIIHDDENFERALKRFKKKCEKAGILSDLRKHRHYEKPSERKKAEDERRDSEESAQPSLRLGMTQLLARIQADLNAARKAQDKARVLLLGTIISDIKNREIELKRDLTDDDVIDVLRRGIKRRRESIEMYDKGGRRRSRRDRAQRSRAVERYLPAGVSDDEIRAAVVAAIEGGASNVGAVMGKVMPQFKGRAEGGTINAIVREELAARTPRPA